MPVQRTLMSQADVGLSRSNRSGQGNYQDGSAKKKPNLLRAKAGFVPGESSVNAFRIFHNSGLSKSPLAFWLPKVRVVP